MRRIKEFTLVELLVALIIVSVLVAVSVMVVKSNIIGARMTELYSTVGSISRAEDMFFYEHKFYAAYDDGIAGYDLPYSMNQARIDAFKDILGLEIPGMESVFVYAVCYNPARIYVRVREHVDDWGIMCYKWIEGPNKGKWYVYPGHPWAHCMSTP